MILNLKTLVWANRLTKAVLWPCLTCTLLSCSGDRKSISLPYHDSFIHNSADEWTPIGGAWEVTNSAVYNRSDENGAKLISGSADWTNYQLDTDLMLIGHGGDVGVVVRSNEEERGVDSYSGYYIGLRSTDSALVAGKADHGWMEGQPIPMKGGVRAGKWYHLHVVAFGCQIGAEAINIETRQTSWLALSDSSCNGRGRIALRSMHTGGAWRDISVRIADEQDWQDIRMHADFVSQPQFPAREADRDRLRDMYFKNSYNPVRSYRDFDAQAISQSSQAVATAQITPVNALRSLPADTPPATVRGVVTLTSPLFIQDSSGGILVDKSSSIELNLGDEVEITGRPIIEGFSLRLEANNIRVLWDRTLVVPISITSTQAASGGFEGSLVELRGILASKVKQADQIVTLRLYDSAQTFTAQIKGGMPIRDYDTWTPGSTLLIRGICTIPSPPGDPSTVFAIITRGMDDVQVLAGPPWWSGKQLIRLLILLFFMVCGAVYFYLRLEKWKMNAILDERERLAHELHDTLAQSFAGIGFHLQGLCNGLRTGQTPQSEALNMLNSACELVAQSHRDASAYIAALHSDLSENQDFFLVLDQSTRELLHSSDKASMPIEFSREGTPQPVSPPIRDALFHIGREAIANMLRHAHASRMEVNLHYEAKAVVLAICDDGVGFDPKQVAPGLGIQGMQRRCTKVGAKLEITSAIHGGTRIRVRAPYGLRPRLMEWIQSFRNRPSEFSAG